MGGDDLLALRNLHLACVDRARSSCRVTSEPAADVHYFFNKFLTDCASSVDFLGDLRALTGHWEHRAFP